jgi:His-Xaa-Ser system protein HxsD
MTSIETRAAQPIAIGIGNSTAALQVDTTLYDLDAVLRACYKYTDRCYLFLTREPESTHLVNVFFMSKSKMNLADVVGEFCNELVDQSLQLALSHEFGSIRDLVVAQAFSEGNLLDPQRDEGDYASDPLGIGERRQG